MENKNWGNTYTIEPWKEALGKETILDIPLPERGPEDPSFRGIKDNESKKVGYTEGRLKNGYPYRMECAEYKGAKVISFFVSKKGLAGVTGEDIDKYLRYQDLYEAYNSEPEIYTYIDKSGRDFWRIDILLELEGDIFSSSPVSIEEFSYSHIAHEFRILLKEGRSLLKVYYDKSNTIKEYSVCSQKDDLFKQKFTCYVLSVLEMNKLSALMTLGRSEKNLIKELQDYFSINSSEDFVSLLKEYSLAYREREEM